MPPAPIIKVDPSCRMAGSEIICCCPGRVPSACRRRRAWSMPLNGRSNSESEDSNTGHQRNSAGGWPSRFGITTQSNDLENHQHSWRLEPRHLLPRSVVWDFTCQQVISTPAIARKPYASTNLLMSPAHLHGSRCRTRNHTAGSNRICRRSFLCGY
jgi:hypothetical protein